VHDGVGGTCADVDVVDVAVADEDDVDVDGSGSECISSPSSRISTGVSTM
jgi:hypothetical protein